jgi:hypothetical protein
MLADNAGEVMATINASVGYPQVCPASRERRPLVRLAGLARGGHQGKAAPRSPGPPGGRCRAPRLVCSPQSLVLLLGCFGAA